MSSLDWHEVDPGGATLAVAAARGFTPDALARTQQRRLVRLLRHAQAESAFYRRTLRGLDADTTPLHGLPVVHKATLMRHFADWVTDPALTLPAVQAFVAQPERIGDDLAGGRGRYAVWESSGSSGRPGWFVHDAGAMAVYDALELQRPAPLRPWQRWLDPFWLTERVAFVGATDGHFASQASLQRLRRRAPWLAHQWVGLSMLQPLPDLLAALQQFAPTILATYPTAAALLAGAAADGRLALSLREVWTGGETLTTAQRARISAAFGCPLRNSYGASEFLPIAAECSHGSLHVNADWVILEPVDARGHPAPADTLSHTTLLTNLANRVQPLIRYDLGDRIRLHSRPCPCGSALPVIDVLGRCDDLLNLAGTQSRSVPLLPLALSTVLEEQAGLYDFMLEQTGPSALRLTVVSATTDAGAAAAAVGVLQRFAADQGARPVSVAVCTAAALPRGRSGKLCRITVAQAPKRPSR